MRPIAFALLLLGATACPHLRRTLSSKPSPRPLAANFRQRSVCSTNFPRHPDTGHCLPIDAHQRFTVIRDLPSACVALKDTQQDDDQWVVVFVRQTDFDLFAPWAAPAHPSARNRHGATVQGASRGVPPPSLTRAPSQPGRRSWSTRHITLGR